MLHYELPKNRPSVMYWRNYNSFFWGGMVEIDILNV